MTEQPERQYLLLAPSFSRGRAYALPKDLKAGDFLEFMAKRRPALARPIYCRVLAPLPSGVATTLHLERCEFADVPKRLGARGLAHAQTEELIDELARRAGSNGERLREILRGLVEANQ